MADVEDYSTTAASNTTDFPEGQAPSTVNNGMRETQADIAAMYQRDNAIITAGGTADALTSTFSPVHAADVAGRVVIIQAASDNATTTPTFQLDSLTARTITKNGGSALFAGDIQAGGFIHLKYDLANTVWELLNPTSALNVSDAAITAAKLEASLSPWVEISRDTASASTNIEITTGIDGTYKQYKLVFENILPSTASATLGMHVGTGATPTWKLAATDYTWSAVSTNDTSSTPVGDFGGAQDRIELTIAIGNLSYNGASGSVTFDVPDNTSIRQRFSFDFNGSNGSFESWRNTGAGVLRDTGNVTAFRFIMSSGTIASGDIVLYGLR